MLRIRKKRRMKLILKDFVANDSAEHEAEEKNNIVNTITEV